MIVDQERAIFLEDISTLLVADLHIGYERELESRGVIVPSQTEAMKRRLLSLVERYGAERIIILGDLKHEILGFPRELRGFLEDFEIEIMLVKGNHDGGIEEMVDIPVHPPPGFTLGRYGFFHGHSWPSQEVMSSEVVFMGHVHPEVSLPGSTGKPHRMPCLLRAELSNEGRKIYPREPKIYILPAFNPLVGASLGLPLGPIMKVLNDPEVYLLNGTYLGRYSEFQSPSR